VIVATFAYSAAGLCTVVAAPGSQPGGSYPQLAVTVAIVLLFASLGALIFFLDHLAHSIQIDRLMTDIERATLTVISHEPPGLRPGSGPGEAPAPPVWAVTVRAHQHGYVQTVIQAIHGLTVLLGALASRLLGDYQITGKNQARVIVHAPCFADYAEQPADLAQVREQAAPLLTSGTS
jgi:uncharacterized membrane protein